MKKPYIGVLLALVRHYVSDEVIAVIKEKVVEALAHGDWNDGDRLAFVVTAANEIAAATPTKADDTLVDIATRLYLLKYASTHQ